VRSGDSFWEIARDHKVGIRELAKWNGMAPGDMLKQGQKLVIWGQKKLRQSREVIRKLTYTVRNGDSLARIASKFRVRVQDLIRWNRQKSKSKYLQPGQKLTLYVDVTN
jgi:membrane-bound lytic murein transglycosylase D